MRRRRKQHLQSVLVFILFPLSVFLMTLPPRWVQPGRTVVCAITGPVELAFSAAFEWAASLPQVVRNARELRERTVALDTRVRELRSEVDFYKMQFMEREKLIAELQKLKSVLPKTGYEILLTEIVGKHRVRTRTGATTRVFTIGIGSNAGLRRDDLVVVGYEVVGKITVVAPWTSQVRLITDPDFRIVARTVPHDVEGVLRGSSPNRCLLEHVGARSPIQRGDYVVTSGFEGIHPPKLLLGIVSKVYRARDSQRLQAEVKPMAHLDRLSHVMVVRRRPVDR